MRMVEAKEVSDADDGENSPNYRLRIKDEK